MKFSELLEKIEKYEQKPIYFSTDRITRNTFSDLFEDVIHAQGLLKTLYLQKRARVGLLGDNSYAWLVWNIALVTGDYVPVIFSEDHFNHTPQQLIEEYGIWALITDRNHGAHRSVINISDFNASSIQCSTTHGISETNSDVLTLAFSSGTTGHMKGLVISRSGTEKIIKQFVEAFEISDKDDYFSFLPFSYFQQAALNYCALFYGVSITVVGSDKITEALAERKPTFIIAPPVFHTTMYKVARMMQLAKGRNCISEILGGNIRFMITAMAPIQPSIIQYYWEGGVHLFETFAVTETGMATWNTPKAYKIGSVGRASEPGTLFIAEDGELLVKRSQPVSLGYFNTSTEIEEETFLPDGSVATGDIVEVDAEGFYRIIGRKKHAIVTREGKKFHPEEVEFYLKEKVSNATPVVYLQEAGQQVAALLWMQEWNNLTAELLKEKISEVNEELPPHKQILSAFITSQTPTWQNGFLTRNLKLNRKNIQQALNHNAFNDLHQIF